MVRHSPNTQETLRGAPSTEDESGGTNPCPYQEPNPDHRIYRRNRWKYEVMAEDCGGETTPLESANEGGEDSGHKPSYLMDCGGAENAKRGQPDDAVSVLQSQTRFSAVDGGFGNGHLYIPPWTINVVALTGESSMESINIPQDVQSDAIHIGTEQKFVSAAYANELLKQIAGLGAIVKQRAHDARDLLSKHQQHTEWILSHRAAEVMALRRELYQFRNKECSTQVEAHHCTAPNYSTGHSKPDNVYEMQQISNEEQIQAAEHTSIKTPSKDMSQAQVGVGGKLHGQIDNPIVATAQTEPSVPAEGQNLRIRSRKHPSVSEHSEDVIYASWKITRSE